MFERFSDRARKTMAYANWFADATSSVEITENHIFAGLLIQNEGIALEVLAHLGVSTDETFD